MTDQNPNNAVADTVRFVGTVLGGVGVLCGTVKAVSDVTEGHRQAWHIVIAVLFVTLSVWFVRLLIAKREVERRVISNPSANVPTLQDYRYSKRERVAAGAFLVLMYLVLTVGVFRAATNPTPATKVTILVANFDGPDSDYGVTESVLEKLRETTKAYPEVRIEPLGEKITAQEGAELARAKGGDRKASIVVWGWYRKTQDKVNLFVHFEMLRKPESMTLVHDKLTFNMPVANLESFTLQDQLASEMNYFALMTIGVVRYDLSDFTNALPCFTDAINQPVKPGSVIDTADVYFFRGTCYGELEDHTNAMNDFKMAIQLKTNSAMAYNNLGNSFFQTGSAEEALSCFEAALRIEPNKTLFIRNRALMHHVTGRGDLALADYNRLVELKSTNSEVFNNRGIILNARGRRDEALADYSHAIELNPLNDAPYLNRGLIRVSLGQLDQAISDFTLAIRHGKSPALAYNNRGSARRKKQDVKGAIADLKEAIRLNPKLSGPHAELGDIYLHDNDPVAAIPNFDKALELDSNYFGIHANRGTAFYLTGKFDRALADFDTELKLYPINAVVYNNRGLVYAEQGDLERAIKDFSSSIGLEPDTLNHLNRAEAFLRTGSLSNALFDADCAIKFGTNTCEALTTRGNILFINKQLDLAAADFSRALSINPRSYLAHAALAQVYQAKGLVDEAVAEYGTAISLKPDYAEAYHNRGNVYSQKGDREKAKQDYAKAAEITKNATVRDSALYHLKQLEIGQ